MKTKSFVNVAIFLMAGTFFVLFNAGCSKDEGDVDTVSFEGESDNMADYSSSVSQDRVLLAHALSEALNKNSDMLSITFEECNKQFDGDRNVLFSTLIKMPASNKKSSISFGDILKQYLMDKTSKSSIVLKNSDVMSQILTNDPLVQIYHYVNPESEDSLSFEGIVVVPEGIEQRSGVDLLVIRRDGTETFICESCPYDPTYNYLVISTNERGGYSHLTVNETQEEELQAKNSNGKKMKITKASFTSIEAKRTFESWWAGEPEVRLTILYASKNNNQWEARNISFMYPKKWLKVNTWKKNGVVWNKAVVDCPYWYSDKQSFERKLIWVEEDGKTKEQEVTFEYTDPNTGLTTTSKTIIPSNTKQDIISENYIDFNNPKAGIQYWGSIKFELEF